METAAEEEPRPLRLKESRFATVVGVTTWAIVLTGLPILVVGAIDFLGGGTIDARILGALNLAAAVTWFATAAGFRYRTIVTLGIFLAGGLLAMGLRDLLRLPVVAVRPHGPTGLTPYDIGIGEPV